MLIDNFYLASDFYVSHQTVDEFNQMTSSIMENGWFQFIENLESVWSQYLKGVNDIVEGDGHQLDFEPITMQEFYDPLIVCLCHLIGATLIFIQDESYSKSLDSTFNANGVGSNNVNKMLSGILLK